MRRERGRRGKKRICSFCVDKIESVDYKDVPRLKNILQRGVKFYPVVYPATAPVINAC